MWKRMTKVILLFICLFVWVVGCNSQKNFNASVGLVFSHKKRRKPVLFPTKLEIVFVCNCVHFIIFSEIICHEENITYIREAIKKRISKLEHYWVRAG